MAEQTFDVSTEAEVAEEEPQQNVPDDLERRVAEYEAVLAAMLGEDFNDVLDAGLVTRRDGTVSFTMPEDGATSDEGSADSKGSGSKGDDVPTPAQKQGGAKSSSSKRAPKALGSNKGQSKENMTSDKVAKMGPKEFREKRNEIFEATFNG